MTCVLAQKGGESVPGRLSQTLSGHIFSEEHHHLLSRIAWTKGWTGRVWVPVPVMELLRLPLVLGTAAPVRVTSSNGSVWVYHSSQFTVPLDAMRELWNARVRRIQAEEKDREAALLASRVAPDELPLSTNGERFDRATEECMLRRVRSHGTSSRYWATEAEAAWLYRTPFTAAYLSTPENGVVSQANELCRPVVLYNVEGTVDPSRFTELTCRRYDPVNYKGYFYKPVVALHMKALALHYNCLHEPQWITPHRAMKLGLSLIPHRKPLFLSMEVPSALVNIATTQRTRAPVPRVPPATDAGGSVRLEDDFDTSEGQYEKSLLIVPPW
ncbi:hypothetical protein LSCM1_05643 [Leishmania martiniquensis]|uniref:Trypanosoma Tc-38 (p38) protein domain-containing protein n=1 Tax=Leishmania martiniquensis TaxID=1580590 RepID=A0A836HSQ6_9TRYP|nr:hypothetical protein LSCM1_05643 [Leishmania martiniquensis]